jgi:hypothetical protein
MIGIYHETNKFTQEQHERREKIAKEENWLHLKDTYLICSILCLAKLEVFHIMEERPEDSIRKSVIIRL